MRRQTALAIRFAGLLPVLAVLAACQTGDTLSSASVSNPRTVPAGPLAPHKDRLFAYRKPLEVRDNGDWLRVPYDEAIDINARDEIPVRKVKSQYVARLPASRERDFTYSGSNGENGVLGAGKLDGDPRFTVVYLHGKDGNRTWGFDDERFGGNFNRLKNLVAAAGGAYLSPDFSDFGDAGFEDVKALLNAQAAGTGRVILACGSLGNTLCWKLADDPALRERLAGLIVLSGFSDRAFIRAAYSSALPPLPVYIGHGARDPVYPLSGVEDLYGALKAKALPVRMTVFDDGNHGTPIRMVDWRGAINWILSVR